MLFEFVIDLLFTAPIFCSLRRGIETSGLQ